MESWVDSGSDSGWALGILGVDSWLDSGDGFCGGFCVDS